MSVLPVAVPLVMMLAALLLGAPILFAMLGAGFLGIWMITGDLNVAFGILKITPYRTAANYTLMAVPMFILMAFMTSLSGMAQDLFDAVADWLSHLKGGVASATVLACGIFGAMSGSSAASATVMSSIAVPNMQRLGYADVLSAGAVAVGSTVTILIPPSIAMVVYGIATETSIGKLLIAGILPGILLGVLLALSILVWVRINPSLAPETRRVPWKARMQSLRRVWLSAALILSLVFLLYAGVVTPTELAALGALSAALIALVLGRLNWKNGIDALLATARSTAMIFMILIGAHVLGVFLTMSQIPQTLVSTVSAMELNRWVVIVAVVVIYFVLSMFMDELPLLLITLPFVFPLVTAMGFDPVWFGVVCMLMIAMGLIFPPVGLLAFIVSASARIELTVVYRGCAVLLLPIILTLALIMIFPQIVLWLPSLMR